MTVSVAGAEAIPSSSEEVAPSNPCQERLDRLHWVMGGIYEVHGVAVEIRSTSPGFGRWIERTFEAHRGSGAPAARFSAAVGDEGPGSRSIHALYRGIVPIVRSRRPSTLARTLLGELEAFSYPTRDDAVFVYATAVELDGLTVLIPSYLAPYLARSRRLIESMGIRMSAGPAVGIDARTGRLRTTETHLRVPEGAADRLETRERPDSELVDIRGRRVDVVCWFSREALDPVGPVSGARSLYTIASDTANLGRLGGEALVALSRVLGPARCFELRGDTPRPMLRALVDAVRAAPTRERESA